MSDEIREFELKLKQWGAEVPPEQVAKLHRAVQLEALRGVVLSTPVDAGRARGAWELTEDIPAAAESGMLDQSGGQAIARGVAVISRIKAFSITWLTNRVPYIVQLEDGSSKQAPRGMVAVTIARICSIFR